MRLTNAPIFRKWCQSEGGQVRGGRGHRMVKYTIKDGGGCASRLEDEREGFV